MMMCNQLRIYYKVSILDTQAQILNSFVLSFPISYVACMILLL